MAMVAGGIETMKMISSTSMMSTNGVTLMSAFWPREYLPPFAPPSFAAIEPLPTRPATGEPVYRFARQQSHRPDLVKPARAGAAPIGSGQDHTARAMAFAMSDPVLEAFDAYVTAALFDPAGGAVFALGDGSVRFEAGAVIQAHDGAILAAAVHPSGEGVITGGDDGRLVWSRASGAETLAEIKGRWIEAVATSAASGLIAFAAGRDLHVRDVADPAFAAVFAHDKSVADVVFDAKGRRLAAATYGGVALWYARILSQKPTFLKWAGSHIAVAFSPDDRFLMSSMQENQLHGWRLSDGKDLRMGGYPAKVKSLVFLAKGMLLATSGAPGAVVWPFGGANGPMGKEAAEIGVDESTRVARVAGAPGLTVMAAGLEDGRVWACDLTSRRIEQVKTEKSAAISALAVTSKGDRLAWGDEDGGAGGGGLAGALTYSAASRRLMAGLAAQWLARLRK